MLLKTIYKKSIYKFTIFHKTMKMTFPQEITEKLLGTGFRNFALSRDACNNINTIYDNISCFFPFVRLNFIRDILEAQREHLETFINITKCFPFTPFKIQIPGFLPYLGSTFDVALSIINIRFFVNSPGKAHQLSVPSLKFDPDSANSISIYQEDY